MCSLSPSPSLLGWLQMSYPWPELSSSKPEVLNWVLPAASPWAELTAVVPTYIFSLRQLRVFQYIVKEVRKDLGAKRFLGKEIKVDPCCRGGRER